MSETLNSTPNKSFVFQQRFMEYDLNLFYLTFCLILTTVVQGSAVVRTCSNAPLCTEMMHSSVRSYLNEE